MRHLLPKKRLLTALAALILTGSCVDSTYDLGNISLKITLGPNGVTLPLGKLDTMTVDTLMQRKELANLITEDGYYAYKLDDYIDQHIDAIVIDPIRDIIPELDPHIFRFTDAALPENVGVKGFRSNNSISMPLFDLTNQNQKGVSISRCLDLGGYAGTPGSDGMEFELPDLSDTEDFSLTLKNIPEEVASIQRLYFSGAPLGTPIYVNFTLGTLAQAVKSGRLTLTINLPQEYELRLENTFGGAASVNGSVLTLRDYTIPAAGAELVFYIAGRNVTEAITPPQTLSLQDDLRYTLTYTGVSNGQTIPSDAEPLFALDIAPRIGNADLVTKDFSPEPVSSSTQVAFEITDLEGFSRVEYIAFTNTPSNALSLRATHDAIPLTGQIPVQVTFPAIYEFTPGITGLSGNVLNTTLDKLTTGGLALPLKGIRLSGSDAVVANGKLTVSKPVQALISPSFSGGAYRMMDLATDGSVDVAISANDMTLGIDANKSEVTAGFSEPVEIDQKINQTFSVPNEVGSIQIARIVDADNGGPAYLTIAFDIKDSPVEHCYFDNIDIILPDFLTAEHPNLDPATNTVHVDRAEYKGQAVTVARIKLNTIKDTPVAKTPSGKKAHLSGSVQILTTVNLPEDTHIDELDKTEITLLPTAVISPLKVSHVTGKMEVDLQKYLTPTTINLDDIRESLGDQNVELNLVAPQITLAVNNPIGVTMIGDIVLLPYDFKELKLDPIVVKDVIIEPAENDLARITKLFVTDLNVAPEGYTLCHVEDLSKLVKIIPSKIDVTFDLQVDDSREQSFAITGEDYPLTVNYVIKLPLKFRDDARIEYSDAIDVQETFEKLTDYEITAEDILVTMKARVTLPIDLDVTLNLLDDKGNTVADVQAVVLGQIKGYNPESDGEYKESSVDIRLDVKDGDLQRLGKITTIRYTLQGNAVGTGSGLKPEQYITADLKLCLKKGISLDLNDL